MDGDVVNVDKDRLQTDGQSTKYELLQAFCLVRCLVKLLYCPVERDPCIDDPGAQILSRQFFVPVSDVVNSRSSCRASYTAGTIIDDVLAVVFAVGVIIKETSQVIVGDVAKSFMGGG